MRCVFIRRLDPVSSSPFINGHWSTNCARPALRVQCQLPLSVHYDGVIVGDFMADLIVEGKVMIELKANQALVLANEAQLVNYLTATGIEIGLLINFGAQRLEFKRKTRVYRPKTSRQERSSREILSSNSIRLQTGLTGCTGSKSKKLAARTSFSVGMEKLLRRHSSGRTAASCIEEKLMEGVIGCVSRLATNHPANPVRNWLHRHRIHPRDPSRRQGELFFRALQLADSRHFFKQTRSQK